MSILNFIKRLTRKESIPITPPIVIPPAPDIPLPTIEAKTPFNKLGLDEALLRILAEHNYIHATKVQEKSIPISLAGKNIFCSSETGSGKTLAFVLPMMQKLYRGEIHQALVICPTREIAIQTQKVLQMFLTEKITSALVIGGTDMWEQKAILKTYPTILVATPGRLLDMLNSGLVWLEYTGYVVLDEADRMLDMGFEEDLLKIHDELSGTHQTVLFSATLFPEVKQIAKRYASDYVEVIIGSPRSVAGSVESFLLELREEDKYFALRYLIRDHKGKMIVFFNTIRETDRVNSRLRRDHLEKVDCIHSRRDQDTRERLITAFRALDITVLLASDVAARGIDIPDVELVVNYDIPNNAEEYIHRVGRTGRAGKTGMAISFYTPEDRLRLEAVEKLIKSKIPRRRNFRNIIKN